MSGSDNSGIKVKGVIQWVPVKDAVDITIRKYDYLLTAEDADKDFSERLNKDSLKVIAAKAEPYVTKGGTFQFIRLGYYCLDKTVKGKTNMPVFNEIVPLKDSFKG